MEMKNNENGNKKYLVPVVALLLCAVACIGVGYAYNSTNTINNNVITQDSEVLYVVDDMDKATHVEFNVDYCSTIVNGGTPTYKVDKTPGCSVLEQSVVLKLDSTTKATKTVTIGCGEPIVKDGITFTVKAFVNDQEITTVDVTPGTPVTVTFKLVVDEPAGGIQVQPTKTFDFTLTFTTGHEEVKAQA